MRLVTGLCLTAFLLGPGVAADAQQLPTHTAADDPALVLRNDSPLQRSVVRALNAQPAATSQAAPKRRDSLLDGLLIGAAVGGLLGLIPDHYDDCEECHDSLYGSIAVGAGVGLLVDALRGRRAPALGPSPLQITVSRRNVVRATLRWR